jgi:hypothetical protein
MRRWFSFAAFGCAESICPKHRQAVNDLVDHARVKVDLHR